MSSFVGSDYSTVYCVLACICVALLYSFFSLVIKYSVDFKKKKKNVKYIYIQILIVFINLRSYDF